MDGKYWGRHTAGPGVLVYFGGGGGGTTESYIVLNYSVRSHLWLSCTKSLYVIGAVFSVPVRHCSLCPIGTVVCTC
jgi:hypothetical protein